VGGGSSQRHPPGRGPASYPDASRYTADPLEHDLAESARSGLLASVPGRLWLDLPGVYGCADLPDYSDATSNIGPRLVNTWRGDWCGDISVGRAPEEAIG